MLSCLLSRHWQFRCPHEGTDDRTPVRHPTPDGARAVPLSVLSSFSMTPNLLVKAKQTMCGAVTAGWHAAHIKVVWRCRVLWASSNSGEFLAFWGQWGFLQVTDSLSLCTLVYYQMIVCCSGHLILEQQP